MSAWSTRPHARHRNRAWLSRDAGFTDWQTEQVCEVLRGSTSTSVEPYHAVLYASWRRNTPQPRSRISRFRPALAHTLVPGAASVPRAERVIALTLSASIATMLCWVARRRESLCSASFRRRATRPRRTPNIATVRALRLEPRHCRASRFSSTLRRRRSCLLQKSCVTRTPADVATSAATPRSTPTGGPPFGLAGRSSDSTQRLTCHPSTSRETVAKRIRPQGGRVQRNRTQPSFVSRTSPHRRLTRRTATRCGKRMPGSRRRARKRGYLASRRKNLSNARSKSRKVCCAAWAGTSASQLISARAAVKSRDCWEYSP